LNLFGEVRFLGDKAHCLKQEKAPPLTDSRCSSQTFWF